MTRSPAIAGLFSFSRHPYHYYFEEILEFGPEAQYALSVIYPEEVMALVRAAESKQDAATYLTAAFTGLRRGELIALRLARPRLPRLRAERVEVDVSGFTHALDLEDRVALEAKRRWARRKMPLRLVSCLLRVRAEVVSEAREVSIAGAEMSSRRSAQTPSPSSTPSAGAAPRIRRLRPTFRSRPALSSSSTPVATTFCGLISMWPQR